MLLLLVAALTLASAGCGDIATGLINAVPAALPSPLFRHTSAFNTEIPSSPRLAADSPSLVRQLSSGSHPGIANLYDYAPAFYEASPDDPSYKVSFTKDWGPQPFADYNPVRIPKAAAPSVGSDGWLVVADRSRGLLFEIWQARFVNGGWTGSWGSVFRLGDDENALRAGSGSGSGLSIMAGVVRQSELEAGVINHALAFSTDMTDPSRFLYPATKTDGGGSPNSYPHKLPEGARIQLDPSVNVDAIPGMTRGERIVARALQRYGAYAVDVGGAHMGFYFEGDDPSDPRRQPPTQPGDATRPGGVYERAGFEWDYFGLDRIPWDRLRVLNAWNGR